MRNSRNRALLAILALTIMLCATMPGSLHGADKWLRLSSENFDMLSCTSERESREMLVQLEQFRTTFFRVSVSVMRGALAGQFGAGVGFGCAGRVGDLLCQCGQCLG